MKRNHNKSKINNNPNNSSALNNSNALQTIETKG
jgi:hypothetical protein